MSRLPSLSVDSKKLVHYGQALHEMGMGFKALQQYDYALELNPNSPIIFHRKGLIYFSKQQYIHAIRCYEQALQFKYAEAYYDNGNAQLAVGQVDKAIESYMQASIHFPNKYCILYQLGVAHYQKKNVVTALKYLKQSLTIEPNSIATIQKQGDIYYDLKMFKKALRHYEKILKLDGLNYKAQYSKGNLLTILGLVFFELDSKEKAQTCFEKCVILQPSYSLPYFNLGVIRSQIGEHREAIKFFKECLNRNPNNSKARYEMGRSFQALGQFEKALQSYSKCPETHQVIFNQGVIQQSMKMYHKAHELFKKAISLTKDKMDYWYHLGVNYFYMDNHTKMADSFEKVIGLGGAWIMSSSAHPAILFYQNRFLLKPTTCVEFYKQGRALCLVQQFDEAVQSFQNAIDANPKFIDAKLELAKVYEHKQQYKDAIIIYKQLDNLKALQQVTTLCLHLKLYKGAITTANKILTNYPQNLDALHSKGLAYQGFEDFQLAIQCFDEILKLQPSNVEAIFQKGVAYKNLQDERARIQFSKVLSYQADSELILLLQGHSHLHQNDTQSAILSYEKAISMNKDFSDAHFGLGFAYYSKQEYLLAVKVYKQYLLQAPKSKQFLLALCIIQYKVARALQKLNKTKKALSTLDQILTDDPQHHEAIHFKATIHYETKNFQVSFLHFQKAIRLKPRHDELLKFL